jgi:hypothetical protein
MVVRIRRPFKGARFIHPIDPAPRTAILAAGFRESRQVRIFPQGWNERAKRFDPGSIAGPLEQLRSLAREAWPLEGLAVDREVCACGNPAPRLARGSRIDELAGLLA